MWPGMSISGTTVMWWRRASSTSSRTSALVRCRSETISGWRLALDPEALVVAQVQVQVVELQPGQLPDVRAKPVGREVLAAHVHHQPALGIAGPVARPAARHRRVLAQQLQQRAGAVEGAGRSVRRDPAPRRRSACDSPRRRARRRRRPARGGCRRGAGRLRRGATIRGRRPTSVARSEASSRASPRSRRRCLRGITIRAEAREARTCPRRPPTRAAREWSPGAGWRPPAWRRQGETPRSTACTAGSIPHVRILSIVHQIDAGSGVFGATAEQRRSRARRVDPGSGTAAGRADFDAVMVFGGGMHPDQEDEHHWLRREKELLRGWLDGGVPMLATCLGSELLAEAAGGGVERLPEPQIGWHEVELTASRRRRPRVWRPALHRSPASSGTRTRARRPAERRCSPRTGAFPTRTGWATPGASSSTRR